MIKLEKQEYKKLSENCYLCYVPKWGDENDWLYVVAVYCLHSQMGKIDDKELDIYGFGKTVEDALLMAVSQLCEAGLRGISFSVLDDFKFSNILDIISRKEGYLSLPEGDVLPIRDGERDLGNMSILIQDNKAWPLST